MLKGKMEFRLGSEQRVCGQGDVIVIPGGTEHEAWFREDTEVIDFFAPARDDFLVGGKPAYMSPRGASRCGAWVIFSTDAGSAVTRANRFRPPRADDQQA